MRAEVIHAYALYEKIEGVIKQSWKCIGVSNRRKDMARLAIKSVELYSQKGEFPDERSSYYFHLLDKTGSPAHTELGDDMVIHHKINRIKIDKVDRRTIKL